jgi:DNA transformation protein
MPISPEFRDHVLDLLAPLGAIRARAMFGGAGIYLGETMFALIADDVLYFKTDASNAGDYEALGMGPFKPFDDKPIVMPYHEVPPDVMEDSDTLCAWARHALRACLSKKARLPERRAREAARRATKVKSSKVKRRRRP